MRAVIFDLDDTLYPEQEFVLSGFRSVSKWAQVHLNIPERESFRILTQLFSEGVRGDTFNRWLEIHGRSQEIIPSLLRVYREHKPCIKPFPEVTNILSDLRKNYQIGLLSDGYFSVQQAKLLSLGLSDFFDVILFTDELGRANWKPSITPFREISRRLGLDNPVQAVYVGDNPVKDFFGAKQIGMGTIWIKRDKGEYVHMQPPTADHQPMFELNSLANLPALLATMLDGDR
ncbi:HAD family hydrolase [Desulfatiglans anilini]|uniref:HAD family hydrolase n=1 Tax=Desulfatiglans anilini TaxID=90728 RepID=UPI001377B793|nr:HAD family hydrolase [Desulfatiglans anilini]